MRPHSESTNTPAKVNSIVRSKATEKLSNESLLLKNLLQSIVREKDERAPINAEELAILWGYADARSAYQVIEGNRQLSAAHFAMLARELCRRGDTRLIQWMLVPGLHVASDGDCETDGKILEEIDLIVRKLGACSEAFEQSNSSVFESQIKELKRNLARLEAEGRQKLLKQPA